MSLEEEYRLKTLDHLVEEKFAEIFFLAKEEYDIESNSQCEEDLYELLNSHKKELRRFCETRQD